jgi:hypothetical protein
MSEINLSASELIFTSGLLVGDSEGEPYTVAEYVAYLERMSGMSMRESIAQAANPNFWSPDVVPSAEAAPLPASHGHGHDSDSSNVDIINVTLSLCELCNAEYPENLFHF